MRPNSIRVIISGGGTGGHIYPAIAIADAIKKEVPNADILFVGANGRMEMEKVPEAGYPIEGLTISGLQRKLTLANLSFPFKVLGALAKASGIVKSFKPDIVIGVGGYASGPLVFAAARRGVPALLQEQNSYAGLTNKILAKYARKICVAYPNMQQYFPADRIVVTGNPVRNDIADLNNKRGEAMAHFGLQNDKKTLLILGGSLGARTLNESLAASYDKLVESGYQVIWQCGKVYIDDLQQRLANKLPESVKLMPFIKQMPLAYAAADVVVSRAGALSIAEICIAEKPVILVPSPNVAEDHQTKNAMALVKENAAVLVKDGLAKQELVGVAIELLGNTEKQHELQKQIANFAKPDAAQAIAEQVFSLVS